MKEEHPTELVPESGNLRSKSGRSSVNSAIKSEISGASEGIIPVFTLTIGVNAETITFTPSFNVFHEVFSQFLASLNESVAAFPLFISDKAFAPVTQPILYGKMENYRASLTSEVFYQGHEQACTEIIDELGRITEEAFDIVANTMDRYREIALKFSTKPVENSAGDSVETDVEVLKSSLSSLR